MGDTQIVFLVWSGLRGKPETHQLRAIDNNREIAERHVSMCEYEIESRDIPGRVWIEEQELNHLCGYDLWSALEHATRLRGKGS